MYSVTAGWRVGPTHYTGVKGVMCDSPCETQNTNFSKIRRYATCTTSVISLALCEITSLLSACDITVGMGKEFPIGKCLSI